MFQQMFMPLDRHYDDGMAATGDAFMQAAEMLVESTKDKRMAFMNGHLPVFYLYRHAIELYLKSAILIIHRYFKMPSGDQPHQPDPLIKIDGKWKPLHRTHSLKTLLSELDRMMCEKRSLIQTLTPSKWDTPTELVAWIDTIEVADEGSTYFRYPKSKNGRVDAEKSGSLPEDPLKALADMQKRSEAGKKGKVILALKDDDNRIVEVFSMQDEPMPELREALTGAAGLMSGCCIGFYMELVRGYGVKALERKANTEAKKGSTTKRTAKKALRRKKNKRAH